jgi:alkanesulfonate monooxygenase SsuD/methylene tetrahydromethanopterin reductase-like flavin-dependent oxidoreductase (luciferase family)
MGDVTFTKIAWTIVFVVQHNGPCLIFQLYGSASEKPISAMAEVIENLAFVIISNTTYVLLFLFAKRMSTLDHLTGGHMGDKSMLESELT